MRVYKVLYMTDMRSRCYCPRCGKRNSTKRRKCIKCGNPQTHFRLVMKKQADESLG